MRKKNNIFPWKKILLAVLAFGFLTTGGLLVWATTVKLPDISTFEARKIANSSKITDRTGEIVLYDIHQSVRRTEIPLEEMGPNIIHAVVAVEDAYFFKHSGIRPTSIIRAVLTNITTGSFSQGGSTITQQIIKNTLLNTNKTIARKFKEWVLALKLERHFSKEQILQIYLNDAPFGSTIYGVEEAAQAFFSKPAKELTIAQSAYMAAMIPAPTYYSPFGQHKDKLTERKNLVLRKMEEHGYITTEERVTAQAEEVEFNLGASNSIKAPHFVFYILDYLQKTYGQDVMESGGYVIKTTIDYDLQKKAEELALTYGTDNEKKYRATNTALVAIEPKTGHILSMVGSRNYFDKKIDGAYNVVTALRQPGSSFKPFVYLTGFLKGYTPETILFDVPTEFSTNCTPAQQPLPGYTAEDCYNPDNFDNKFKGPITLKSALAESRNIPSVKLLYLVGVNTAVETAHKLGISTLNDPSSIGLSLVLGGGEVKLLDMVSAYSVLANNGTKNNPVGIIEIRDRKGTIIESYENLPTEIIEKNAVATLNAVLSDEVLRRPTFGQSITIPGVAVKTGTTNEEKDAWIIGYTPDIAIGVWSGNNDNKSMTSGGAAVSGPLWKELMTEALKTYTGTPFEVPIPDPDYQSLKPVLRGQWMGNEVVYIDKITGLRATEKTPLEARIEKVITDVKDILYWVDKENPRGESPRNPGRDPQFNLWNTGVEIWWRENASKYNSISPDQVPSEYETVHTEASISPITVSGISEDLQQNSSTKITIGTTGVYPLTSVDVSINNTYLVTLSNPFNFFFTPKEYGYTPGEYTLKLSATNSVFAKSYFEQKITISE